MKPNPDFFAPESLVALSWGKSTLRGLDTFSYHRILLRTGLRLGVGGGAYNVPAVHQSKAPARESGRGLCFGVADVRLFLRGDARF